MLLLLLNDFIKGDPDVTFTVRSRTVSFTVRSRT